MCKNYTGESPSRLQYNKHMKLKDFRWKKLFQSEDSRFALMTGLKISGLYLLTVILVMYMTWIILSLNNVFFESQGFFDTGEVRTVFYDFIMQSLWQDVIHIAIFFILLLFGGFYIARILLRPFALIGVYCENAKDNKNASYNPDIFSDFKLLTRFSEFFFVYLIDAREKKLLEPNTIPPSFQKVRGPVFDRVFFFHFSLFIGIVALVTSLFVSSMTTHIHVSMVELAIKSLPNNGNEVAYFLKNQEFLFESIRTSSIVFVVISYFSLAIHLYSRVSGAVFGFFSTMRSFMKGNSNARVHLLGYNHIRPYGRMFNKYLDQVCRELDRS